VRSSNSTGSGTWTTQITVLGAGAGVSGFPHTHLQVTSGGEPGVIFNGGSLLANIAKNKVGDNWESGGKIVSGDHTLGFGAIFEASDSGIAAAVIEDGGDGLPRLSVFTTENAFGIGSGASWDNSADIVATRTLGDNVVLRRHGSKAAVIYLDTSNDTLNFVESTSSTGLTWGAPQVIDFGIEGDVFDLMPMGAALVAVYYDAQDGRLESASLL
jgi:hypothetical protein